MNAIAVSIVRWVDDEPQPGIVECKLTDLFGRDWTFIEKSAVVTYGADEYRLTKSS